MGQHLELGYTWHLKGFDLFSGLGADELQELERGCRMMPLRRGAIVYLPGEKAEHVYALRSGVIKLGALDADGREATLALLDPGELFGELEIIDGTARAHVATAQSEATVSVIPRTTFLRLMKQHSDFAFRVSVRLGHKVQEFQSKISCLVFKGAHSRLSELLLELVRRYGEPASGGTRLRYRFSHRELACLIGVARETVSYTMAEFRRDGLIATERGRIVVCKPELLAGRI